MKNNILNAKQPFTMSGHENSMYKNFWQHNIILFGAHEKRLI